MTVDEILSEVRLAADPQRVASLKRVGSVSPALGVGLPRLRSLAKRIGHDHRLALALWQTCGSQKLARRFAGPSG
jgi:hypothetical protein